MPAAPRRDCGLAGPHREAGQSLVPEQAHEAQTADAAQRAARRRASLPRRPRGHLRARPGAGGQPRLPLRLAGGAGSPLSPCRGRAGSPGCSRCPTFGRSRGWSEGAEPGLRPAQGRRTGAGAVAGRRLPRAAGFAFPARPQLLRGRLLSPAVRRPLPEPAGLTRQPSSLFRGRAGLLHQHPLYHRPAVPLTGPLLPALMPPTFPSVV